MTLEDVRNRKAMVRHMILCEVREFTRATGLRVERIVLNATTVRDAADIVRPEMTHYDVDVVVRL